MRKMKNLKGQKFGRLTAICPVGKNRQGAILWLCNCDCGMIKTDEAGTLDFSGVPAFLVTNAFIVQRSAAKMFNIVSGPQLLSIHQGFCDYRPGFQCPWTHGP